MARANPSSVLEVVTNLVLECNELPGDDQLVALQLAWWVTAANIRHAEVEDPTGPSALRDNQAAILEEMAAWVRGYPCDAELERLWLEADHEGFVKHLRRLHHVS